MGADPLGYLQLLWRANGLWEKTERKGRIQAQEPLLQPTTVWDRQSETRRNRPRWRGFRCLYSTNDLPIQQPRAPIFRGSNQGARYGCRKWRCDRDKPREAQQTEQRSGYRAASLSEEAAEKPYDCACQKSSQMLPGQSIPPVVLSKEFHAAMGLEKTFAPVVQFLPLCTGFSLRRDSTEQELVRQVGTPSLGSSHWVNTR